MTWSLASVWLGLILCAVALWPVHPLLLLVPGVAAVVLGLLIDHD